MAHSYAEIEYESRGIEATLSGVAQTFVLSFKLDPDIEVEAEGEFEIFDWQGDAYYDDVVALEYAYSTFPLVRFLPDSSGELSVLVLTRISLDHTGPDTWKATGSYNYDVNTGVGGERGEEEVLPYVKLGFTIGGGTREITKSLESFTPAIADGSLIPSVPGVLFRNLIGVSKDGVKGTTIPNSTFRLQITAYYYPSAVDLAFAVTIQELIAGPNNYGTYNNAPFLGTAIGETQLLTASGGGTVVDIIPITYEFSLAKNLIDVPDEGFPPLTAKGHDLIDYGLVERYDPDSKLSLVVPEYRIVHRIADPADYSLLKLPVE